MKLSHSNTVEDAFLIIEKFDKLTAENLWNKLSIAIEKRSFSYVNRYTKTDMEIAAVIFDRQRKVRWSGLNGKNYVSLFSE